MSTHTARVCYLPSYAPRWLLGLACLVFPFCLGCRSGHADLLEGHLRERESELYRMRDELCRSRAYNEAMTRELSAVRQQTPGANKLISPELASQTYTLKTITLGRPTGGVNDDQVPGDEALQVVVEAKDPDGHSIKAPGTLTVQAIELNSEGLKRPLCAWVIANDDLRRSWKGGLFGSGYNVTLPWKAWPTTEKLRVIATFQTSDGRSFEAEKDVTVKLAPIAFRPGASPIVPGLDLVPPVGPGFAPLPGTQGLPAPSWPTPPPATPSPDTELLPVPRKVPPSDKPTSGPSLFSSMGSTMKWLGLNHSSKNAESKSSEANPVGIELLQPVSRSRNQ